MSRSGCLLSLVFILSNVWVTKRVCGMKKKGVMSPLPIEERLKSLRSLMVAHNISAYIVPSTDDHQSEMVQEADKRREFISGFTGSAALTVITDKEALLWTDSRYFIQAKRELDPNLWTLMNQEKKKPPKVEKWLSEHLQRGSRVGADPRKFPFAFWQHCSKTLDKAGIEMVTILPNLIDEIWSNKPPYSMNKIFVYPVTFAGESYEDKIKRLRKRLTELKADSIVIYGLDEIAWLFNLRGSDVEYEPVFRAYSIVTTTNILFFINEEKLNPQVREHLHSTKTEIKEYEEFWDYLKEIANSASKIILPSSKVCGANYYIYECVSPGRYENVSSPVMEMKSYKNNIELEGMRHAQIRESVAICELIFQMSTEILGNISWTELKVDERLSELRSKQMFCQGDSFSTISAFGANAALPHYRASELSNFEIDASAPLTVDTGGQFLDGTTDTTRVLHFGKPSKTHIEVYTALLKGVIDLASTVFPEGIKGDKLDFIIRRPLFKIGRNYGHGSTHGTGIFLNVHEEFNGTYRENFIGSQEPGYYKEGDFGMRLENLVAVVPAKDVQNFTDERLMTFETLTLVPYERKLISIKDMDPSQITWLNDYHSKVRKEVGNEMIRQGKHELYRWLVIQTETIKI